MAIRRLEYGKSIILAQNLIPLKFRQRFLTATSPPLPCAGSPGTIEKAPQVNTPEQIEGNALSMDRARAVTASAAPGICSRPEEVLSGVAAKHFLSSMV